MAMALGLDYWVVPEVTSFFTGQYRMDATRATKVLQLVKHVLGHKGLGHLILDSSTEIEASAEFGASHFNQFPDNAATSGPISPQESVDIPVQNILVDKVSETLEKLV